MAHSWNPNACSMHTPAQPTVPANTLRITQPTVQIMQTPQQFLRHKGLLVRSTPDSPVLGTEMTVSHSVLATPPCSAPPFLSDDEDSEEGQRGSPPQSSAHHELPKSGPPQGAYYIAPRHLQWYGQPWGPPMPLPPQWAYWNSWATYPAQQGLPTTSRLSTQQSPAPSVPGSSELEGEGEEEEEEPTDQKGSPPTHLS